MPGFMLRDNFFEFNSTIKQQISGTTIDARFALSHVCLFMGKSDTSFLETQQLQPLVWLRYIDNLFFTGKMPSFH